MIRNMQIRSKLIAVLVIPLVGLTVLAAIGIASSVSRGVKADRVNDQAVFAVSLSKLVHELQRERDLSAGWVGSGRDAGYGGVVTQRVAVNQALQTFRNDVENLDPDTEGSAFRRAGRQRPEAVRPDQRGAPADRGRPGLDRGQDAGLLLEQHRQPVRGGARARRARPTTAT